jgi:hypothetical protein
LLLAVLVKGYRGDRSAPYRLPYVEQVPLRQRESNRRGPDQGEYGERNRIAGVDDVSDIQLPPTDPTVERRRNGGIAKLDLALLIAA